MSDDQAAGTAGDFGDLIDTKPFDDRIERRRDRRQGTELLDHAIARGKRRTTQNRGTVLITHRFGPSIAVLVRKHGHQPHRKAFGEVIDHVFAGGEIDFECFAFRIGEIGEAAVKHGFGGRDELHYNSVAVGKRRINRRQQARQLHR